MADLYRNVDARPVVQSEARRRHIHGPLVSLFDEARLAGIHPVRDAIGIIAGAGAVAVAAYFAIIAFTGA